METYQRQENNNIRMGSTISQLLSARIEALLSEHGDLTESNSEQYRQQFLDDLFNAIQISPLIDQKPIALLTNYFSSEKGRELFACAADIISIIQKSCVLVSDTLPDCQNNCIRFFYHHLICWYPGDERSDDIIEETFIIEPARFVRAMIKAYLHDQESAFYVYQMSETEINDILDLFN